MKELQCTGAVTLRDQHVHHHPTWEMIYVRKGNGVLHIAGRHISFEPGDIFLVRPQEPHGESAPEGYDNYFLLFNTCFLPPAEPYYFLHDTSDFAVHKVLTLLVDTYTRQSQLQNIFCDVLFETVYQYMRLLLPTASHAKAVELLRLEIERNFCNPEYTVFSSEDHEGSNQEYIRRSFTKIMGVTPLQYLINLRINYAKKQIQNRKKLNLSMKEIALNCGYTDYYYFSRQFKARTGLSPRQWENITPYHQI